MSITSSHRASVFMSVKWVGANSAVDRLQRCWKWVGPSLCFPGLMEGDLSLSSNPILSLNFLIHKLLMMSITGVHSFIPHSPSPTAAISIWLTFVECPTLCTVPYLWDCYKTTGSTSQLPAPSWHTQLHRIFFFITQMNLSHL